MKVLLSWLREFADGIQGSADTLSEVLDELGLTVESMTVTGVMPDGLVLAKVVDLRPHPNADRMQLVDIDDGSGRVLQVCCGAFNMQTGDLIPFARVGTVMPEGLVIKRRRIRGEESAGMCCSEAEIGMGNDTSGILVLNQKVVDKAKLGMPLGEALGMQLDVLWDLEVGANRPDAMCVMGVARDMAAKLGVKFQPPEWPELSHTELSHTDIGYVDGSVLSPDGFVAASDSSSNADCASVEILDPTLCGRFGVRQLRNVTVCESPRWLADRLIALGMRTVNNIVDISNYVMLELGQPSHAFDLDRLPSSHLRVRRAKQDERLVTLDGVERVLSEGDGVIADEEDRVISIAGVMGGASTEISDSTLNVLLEMAWWDPPSISRTVKRMNLSSEAATRFRRGTDWGENVERSFRRFVSLLAESVHSSNESVCSSSTVEAWGHLPSRAPLRVRTSKVNQLLGTSLQTCEIANYLRSIGFVASTASENRTVDEVVDRTVDVVVDRTVDVMIPTWRWDTSTETDICEEVARLHGYENIVRTVPSSGVVGCLTSYQKARRLVREVLLGAGCDEIQPIPFVSPGSLSAAGLPLADAVTLTNPVDRNEPLLRTSMLPSTLKVVAYNQRHLNGDVRLFEVGHVYLKPQAGQLLPDEREYLCVALSGKESPEAVAVLDLLSEALSLPRCSLHQPRHAHTHEHRSANQLGHEPTHAHTHEHKPQLHGLHPTRSAEVIVASQVCGHVGEIAPDVLKAYGIAGRVAWLELDIGKILQHLEERNFMGGQRYKAVSKYPVSEVDLSFVTPDNVAASEVEKAIWSAVSDGALVTRVDLLDVYRGSALPENARSLTYRLRFQAQNRTLTDAEIVKSRQVCIDKVDKALNVKLRS